MLENIKNKAKEDKGNAIAIIGLFLIILSLLVGGLMLDLTKAYQFKSSYIEAAKKATQAGIRIQSSEGYLTSRSVSETIRVYEMIARPSTMKVGNDAYMSRCGVGKNNSKTLAPRNITIRLGNVSENGNVTIGTEITNLNLDKIITLRDRYIKNYGNSASVGAFSPQSMNNEIMRAFPEIGKKRKEINMGKYNYIQMEIYESTPNLILPAAFSASGGDKNDILCQKLGVRASASQYIELNN